MATKSGITKSQQEVIPSSELPQFEQALGTMSDLETALEPVAVRARSIAVIDAVSFTEAGSLIAQAKAAQKTGDATMATYDAILKRVKDYVQTRKLRVKNKAEEIRAILEGKMGEYTRSEERAAQAERDRIAREQRQKLEREAEEKRRADEAAAKELRERRVTEIRQDLADKKITKRQAEKFLREAGAMEEALKAQAAADADEAKENAAKIADKVKVEPNVPTVAGVVKRVNWKFRIVNPNAVKLQYLCPDEVKIGARVRELKDPKRAEAEIGGIEVFEERTF